MSDAAHLPESGLQPIGSFLLHDADADRPFFTWVLRCRQRDHQTLKRLFVTKIESEEGERRAPPVAEALTVVLEPSGDDSTPADGQGPPIVAFLFPDETGDGVPPDGIGAGGQRLPAESRPRKGARRGRNRRTIGWESLTGTELQVALLAAEGLTNRQIGAELFISRRTAETHLSHVYQKLGVSNRAQVAAEVARRQA